MVDVGQEELKERAELFEQFLGSRNGEGYHEKLSNMLSDNQRHVYRLEVNMADLEQKKRGTMSKLLEYPAHYLPCFEVGLYNYCMTNEAFEKYQKESAVKPIRLSLTGRFGSHYVTPRGLNSSLVTKLVQVEGVVTSVSNVLSRLTSSIYFTEDESVTNRVKQREHRDNMSLLWQDIKTSAMLKQDAEGVEWTTQFGFCKYKDQQHIIIQEMPEHAPTGQIPVSVVAMIEQDHCDTVKPGDRVRVVGVYKAFPKTQNGLTNGIFPMRIVCNSVKKMKEHVGKIEMQLADTKAIRDISRRPDFFDLLARSFAPSISGNELVKKGLLLLAVGGAEKNFDNGTHLRGDINVLLVGDPSCGKSQMLRFVMNISEIAISTTGRGSSGVGLTAAVKVNQQTGERTLEAGAMVLGDRGVVLIDEFDKMGVNDRVAIHEVMEQQTVTIAKAGIHTTLNARCSVLAAANPIYSNWDDSMTLAQNIALPDSLLSRFDLIFVLKDELDDVIDRKISDQVLRQLMHREARHMAQREVVEVHDSKLQTNLEEDPANKKPSTVFQQNHPAMADGQSKEILSLEFLKKYLKFCKDRAEQPTLTKAACEKIGVHYAELRQMMKHDQTHQGQLAVTTRTLEGMIRLATAHAKLRLSKEVTVEDVEVTRKLLMKSRSMESKVAEYNNGEDPNAAARNKRGRGQDDDNMDVDEEEDEEAKRQRVEEQEAKIDENLYLKFKDIVFTMFRNQQRYDLPLDEIQEKVQEDTKMDNLEYDACLQQFIRERKGMMQADILYLTA